MPLKYAITVSGATVSVSSVTSQRRGVDAEGDRAAPVTGGYFIDPVTQITYTCVVQGAVTNFVDSNNTVYPFTSGGQHVRRDGRRRNRRQPRGRQRVDARDLPGAHQPVRHADRDLPVNVPVAYASAPARILPMVNGPLHRPANTAPISNSRTP